MMRLCLLPMPMYDSYVLPTYLLTSLPTEREVPEINYLHIHMRAWVLRLKVYTRSKQSQTGCTLTTPTQTYKRTLHMHTPNRQAHLEAEISRYTEHGEKKYRALGKRRPEPAGRRGTDRTTSRETLVRDRQRAGYATYTRDAMSYSQLSSEYACPQDISILGKLSRARPSKSERENTKIKKLGKQSERRH